MVVLFTAGCWSARPSIRQAPTERQVWRVPTVETPRYTEITSDHAAGEDQTTSSTDSARADNQRAERLALAQVGVPLWVTELSAEDDDPNREADFYDRALRALYGHPAVEGILFWGFSGYKEAADGTQQLTPSAVRVLDLLEKQWMTNDTRPLAAASSQYTVRGFHGDYELRVVYKGQELTNLRRLSPWAPMPRMSLSMCKHSTHAFDCNI
ncbi:hypothetical protein C0Q70_12088 [Pomacea canaliculata]|uniref:GH10 domain-containing protein n=1 Tax=Pomacea canaliculata TaxID=400727 RepID=A0A2T7P0J4_POMCA|nr:hypothetical protein C0Q70_12088 [Pomacea canaliculata]